MSKSILALGGSRSARSTNYHVRDLPAGACLALPLRGTGITEQGILASGHAADIRRALTLLTAGALRE
jgi:hypothetical protein